MLVARTSGVNNIRTTFQGLDKIDNGLINFKNNQINFSKKLLSACSLETEVVSSYLRD